MISEQIGKENILIVRRAASAVGAVLKTICQDYEVIVPVNICYSAVYPIVYSGNRPVFCDIAGMSGQVSLTTVQAKVSSRTRAMLIPHMYGNPVPEIEEIAAFCKSHGIVLIEDCASAMGATHSGRMVGSWGDYAVFSTGHAKVVDAGDGGFLMSKHDISQIREVYKRFEDNNSNSLEAAAEEFSRTYRRFLNTRKRLAEFSERQYFNGDYRNVFLQGGSPRYGENLLEYAESHVIGEIERRREKQKCFEGLFSELVPSCGIFMNSDGGVPWRFSFFVDPQGRQLVADALLAAGMPVSDWYPPVNELFDDTSTYPNAEKMGGEILNLPLTLQVSDFTKACKIISAVKGEK